MTAWLHRRLHASGDGAAAVEFAIIMIPLFLLLFGIVEFGIAYNRQQGIHAATREAARVASIGAAEPEIAAAFDQTVDTVDGADVDLTLTQIETSIADGSTTSGFQETPIGAGGTPCDGATSTQRVRVASTITPAKQSDYGISIPFFGQVDMSFPSTAVFVCEPRN